MVRDSSLGNILYGVIYGRGVVTHTYDKDSYFTFEVTYDNGQRVPYTQEGIPSWGIKNGEQTVFDIEDINVMDMIEHDMSPNQELLSIKKIAKYMHKGKLEARCPSGIWHNVSKCPESLLEDYISSNRLHLFRKEINVE